LAQKALVLPSELAGAFVTDLQGSAPGIQTIYRHPRSRFLEPDLLLILERAHRRQAPEVVVQRGDAHAGDLRELLDTERFGKVVLDPGDRFCRSLTLITWRRNGAKASALWPLQDARPVPTEWRSMEAQTS
jgi:hypothetical protein